MRDKKEIGLSLAAREIECMPAGLDGVRPNCGTFANVFGIVHTVY